MCIWTKLFILIMLQKIETLTIVNCRVNYRGFTETYRCSKISIWIGFDLLNEHNSESDLHTGRGYNDETEAEEQNKGAADRLE